ncbi:restriction endonuclease subunit S [Ruminococcus albus]|uniref:Restriction modification system DNA specificity domain n=1 Tax=Ruminococcus albus (strain ATCC 27210 / DSM 20455 / JCM 14654 / NCDO 2250 / 7) TaxID=697329 RepID=E6UKY1_RUMA7|nr:restriction endonuclease subunit S [Ruminococcus albus]ADU24327.1 restriction modification system DNA specificity domain [Ruminococcus albus 7 = DSM 20455]
MWLILFCHDNHIMALCLLASSFVNELPMANSYYDSLHYEKFPDGSVKCIEDEIPFELPEGWRWDRLGNVSIIARGGSPRPIESYITDDENGINWIKIGDTEKDGKYIFKTKEKIKPEGLSKSRYVESGDFLLTNSMSFGRPYILRTDGCIHDGWLVIGNIDTVFNQDFLYYALSSDFMYQTLSLLAAGSTVKNLKSDTVKSVLFPIPPMREQKRIAEKLDSLISFVIKIESDKTDLQTTIQLTKSKILDLAIRGKLVPQNPDDEPASVLLERIRAEKEELIKQGKIKRDKKESVIFRGDDNSYYETIGSETTNIDDKIPFDLPDGWSFERLCNIASFSGGKTPSTSKDEYWGNDYFWITSKDMKSKYIDSSQISLSEKGAEIMQIIAPDTLLLVARSGILRHTLPVAILKRQATINQDIKAISIYNTSLVEFIYTFLKGMENSILLRYTKSGTTVENINFDEFKSIVIPIPPLNEQKRIADKVSQLFSLLDSIAENVN